MTSLPPMAAAFVIIAVASTALADEPRPHARVMVESVPMRSGPGAGFREVHRAERDSVFPIRQRSSRGYFFQVELPDGTTAWVHGDAVHVHELTDREATKGRFLPKLFAPPPLPEANVELAITFGALGRGGLMALRPTWLIQPVFGLELTAAVAVSSAGRLFLVGAGGVVNPFPNAPIAPFAVVGGGGAASDPNADTFVLRSGAVGMVYAGGGLRFSLRYRLTLRIEARAYGFFEPDKYVSQEEYTGGLTVFF